MRINEYGRLVHIVDTSLKLRKKIIAANHHLINM
jgi:hypothetical protein